MSGNSMFNAGTFVCQTPFRKRMVKRPFIPQKFDIENVADNVYEINAPRSLKLGLLLDEYTGEPVLDDEGRNVYFELPLAEERNEQSIILIGASGSGKCLAKGTKVLMFDGSLKKVEDIVKGDKLMGVDSKPRIVLDLAHGFDEMYEVRQKLGEKYTVNSEHILMVKFGEEIHEVKASEFEWKLKSFKKNATGYKAKIDFDVVKTVIDPFVMGAWFARKQKTGLVATFKNVEVVSKIEHFFINNKIEYNISLIEGETTETFEVRISKTINEVFKKDLTCDVIPSNYIYNSYKVRKEFLEGYMLVTPMKNGDFVVEKSPRMKYLVNSLGMYYCELKNYVAVKGNFSEYKLLVPYLSKEYYNKIEVENVGMGEYFGFVLDGDSLFLLEDFTVSHNTVAAARLMDEMRRKYGRCLVIFDVKNQYISMSQPNRNPKHVEILREHGEEPEGVENVRVYIPRHMIKKFGKEVCENLYEYTDIWTIKTSDLDASSMLILGNKDKDGKDYVNMLCGIMDNIKEQERENGFKITVDSLMNVFQLETDKPGKKRSGDVLMAMLDNLANSSLISDDGNDITELFHKPKAIYKPETDTYVTTGKGDVAIFNSAGAGADDIQTIAIVNNMVSSICNNLILKMNKQYKIPLYRPFITVEESSVYYGKDSDPSLLRAFNYLENVMGRSSGIGRMYIYQKEEQVPKGILYGDNCVQVLIRLMKSTKLAGDGMREGPEIFKKGLAKVEIRNVGYMNNKTFLIQILPPKCDISS
jgi:hypothetical protein